jgi:phospholipid-binding lipoprotein MlaA
MLKNSLILIVMTLVSACASGPNKDDPWENWNRGVYKFNKSLDSAVLKPIAKGYKAVTPDVVETGISNAFSNLEDVPNMLNNLFQGKFTDSISDLGRFVVNSTLGVAGLWDPASSLGLTKNDEDFGQTLGAWGVASGPYVMLPFLGPSTLRDTASMPVDSEMDLLSTIEHIRTRNQLKALELIDKRVSLFEYEKLLEDAIDEYAFLRDNYLQNRQYKVLDGDIPFEDECADDESGEDEFAEDCDF